MEKAIEMFNREYAILRLVHTWDEYSVVPDESGISLKKMGGTGIHDHENEFSTFEVRKRNASGAITDGVLASDRDDVDSARLFVKAVIREYLEDRVNIDIDKILEGLFTK